MSDSLGVYLHDHLAGANFAIELLKSVRNQQSEAGLAGFAGDLLVEIQEDADVVQNIIEQAGKDQLNLKEVAARLAEKASLFKLKHESPENLGTFESLETLNAGIMGKLALWRALPVISEVHPKVPPLDYRKLADRALDQYARVEEQRLRVARLAFGNTQQA